MKIKESEKIDERNKKPVVHKGDGDGTLLVHLERSQKV